MHIQVSSAKFLSFVVRHRRNVVNPAKITAITELPPPTNKQELRGFKAIAYICRFISSLSRICDSFQNHMKNNAYLDGMSVIKRRSSVLKHTLLNLPSQLARSKRNLLQYISPSTPSVLYQHKKALKERKKPYITSVERWWAQKYISHKKSLFGSHICYPRPQSYLQQHHTKLISKANPLKYILNQPTRSGRLVKWLVLFQQYDIQYVPQKAIKGQDKQSYFTGETLVLSTTKLVGNPILTDLSYRDMKCLSKFSRYRSWAFSDMTDHHF